MAFIARLFAIHNSTLASTLRGWRGTAAFRPNPNQPDAMLILYEFENCPYCRLVREVLTELDLDVEIRPCPPGGHRYRDELRKRGGRMMVPYLVDPNTGIEMYESGDIIRHLKSTYGRGSGTVHPMRRVADVMSASLSSTARLSHGQHARPSSDATQPLELYSFESSPFSRLVRERLSEMELRYILRNTGKAKWQDMGPPQLRAALFPDEPISGRNRKALLERTGKVQLPYLIDPNTGTEMYESDDIIAYLDRTYGA